MEEALNWLAEIMRVNSPGPALGAAPGVSAAAGGGGGGAEALGRVPSESLWINRVTLPASSAGGAALAGVGNDENESGGTGLASSRLWFPPPSEAKRSVTLVGAALGVGVPCPKPDSD